jgi:hypothetical protein
VKDLGAVALGRLVGFLIAEAEALFGGLKELRGRIKRSGISQALFKQICKLLFQVSIVNNYLSAFPKID